MKDAFPLSRLPGSVVAVPNAEGLLVTCPDSSDHG